MSILFGEGKGRNGDCRCFPAFKGTFPAANGACRKKDQAARRSAVGKILKKRGYLAWGLNCVSSSNLDFWPQID
jgi:hypothetical protein